MGTKRFIVALQGGLGNQMFQYCFGNYLEMHEGVEVTYLTNFADKSLAREATQLKDIVGLLRNRQIRRSLLTEIRARLGIRFGKLDSISGRIRSPLFRVTRFNALTDGPEYDFALDRSNHIYLGFFQSPHYSDKYPEVIEHMKKCIGISQSFEPKTYVAMHLRRGDYVNNPADLGVLSSSFYLDALQILNTRFSLQKVHVFGSRDAKSDAFVDALQKAFPQLAFSWARESNEWNRDNQDALADMRAIAAAGYVIMSNSSYSWWATRLGEPHFAVCPAPWFANGESDPALIFPTWYKLEASFE